MSNWEVSGSAGLDVIPNLDAYYFMNDKDSIYTEIIGHASQLSTYIEEGNSLWFDIANELNSYGTLLSEIRSGKYISLYMDISMQNHESLISIQISLYDSQGKDINLTREVSIEELLMNDFTVRVDLPSEPNLLKKIEFTPLFRKDAEYCIENSVGIPRFEVIEWNEQMTFFDEYGNKFMNVPLENKLLTSPAGLELAYLFNDELEYLKIPEDVEIGWRLDDEAPSGFNEYILQIPECYLNPDDPTEELSFIEGDPIILRYNSPVQHGISVGIGKIYFQKKPYGYDQLPLPLAECILINAENSDNYTEYMNDYYYQIPLTLTPFDTEYMNTYKALRFDINLTELRDFAIEGEIKFSNIIFSVPYPTYELTIDQVLIQKETLDSSEEYAQLDQKIWQYSEIELFNTNNNVSDDTYSFTPPTDIFGGQVSWWEYLKMYDENYNYYSAGINGDDNQLLWSSNQFTWNPSFDRFQDYFGTQIELPMMAEPNTSLYIEYCKEDSWQTPIQMDYENVDFNSIEIIYDYDYLLTPRYEDWYAEIVENSHYDYEVVQYYEESFKVYSEQVNYTYHFETDYSLADDFTNAELYKVVGLSPAFEETIIKNDSIEYNITFDLDSNKITITDLNPENGLLNYFDLITVIINFSAGPVSSSSEVILSQTFNQTYLSIPEETFYDYLTISFLYSVESGEEIFATDSDTLTSTGSPFEAIDFTRNLILSTSNKLHGYDSGLFINFELYEDDSNIIYEADLDKNNSLDYKQTIDVDRNGEIDIVKYGIKDPEFPGEIIWHTIIQDYETEEVFVKMKSSGELRTKWFDIDDAILAKYSFDPADLLDILDPEEWLELVDGKNIIKSLAKYLVPMLIPDMDFWAQRSVQQQSTETRYTKSKYYSIRIDFERDGYADKQISYEKTDVVVEYEDLNNEKTIIAAKEQNLITRVFDYIAKSFESLLEGTRTDPVFNDKLTEEKLDSGQVNRELRNSYRKFTKTTTSKYIDEYVFEQLIVQDWNEGVIEQTRIYSDEFNGNDMAYNYEDSQTVRVLATQQHQEIPFIPELSSSNPSMINWDVSTWGSDNMPVKFDSLTTITEGNEEIDNYYEKTITLVIPNRFSLYYDYGKQSMDDVKDNGNVKFEVSGIFVTPPDGKVYYTSDKDLIKSGRGKVNGHYFYYDSTDNGFYDLVYILALSEGNNEYSVIAIGLNYDGKHDFVPYEKVNKKVKSETNFDKLARERTKFNVWSYHFGRLKDNELIFPEDEYDGYEVRDQIFEISKLTQLSERDSRYSELFYEIKHNTYEDAWEIFSEQLWREVGEQVFMTCTASAVSAAVTAIVTAATLGVLGLGHLAGTAAYFVVYTLMTKYFIDVKMHEADSKEKAVTFYPEGITREPKSINEKFWSDRILGDSMAAALAGHPGAYYTTVRGGEIGNMYTAQAIVSPPNSYRSLNIIGNVLGTAAYLATFGTDPDLMFGLDFDNTNLDFSLLTSELYSYNDREFYSYEEGTGFDSLLRDWYRYNTLSYLEQKIARTTYGELDTIKPVCYDGRPEYIFVDGDSDYNQRTLPLSPLYKPIVISEERYNKLKPADGHLTIQTRCRYSDDTKGVDPNKLSDLEREMYGAKIPLADDAFDYSISKIIIKVIKDGSVKDTVKISSQDYVVDGGNLYFMHDLENLVFGNSKSFNEQVYYEVHIYFARVIADSGSDDDTRLSLSQATSYAIMDYFNQYTFAQTTAEMISEIGYTEIMTLISTAISTAAIMLGSYAVKGISAFLTHSSVVVSKAALKNAVKRIAVETVKSTVKEMFEEIVYDSLIEALAENLVSMAGGTAELGFWVSSSATSARETASGPGRSAMSQTGNSIFMNDIIQSDMELQQWYAQEFGKNGEGMTEAEFMKKNRKKIDEMIAAKLKLKSKLLREQFIMKAIIAGNNLKGIALYASQFFFGGFLGYSAIQTIKSFSKKRPTQNLPPRIIIDYKDSSQVKDSFKKRSGNNPLKSRTLVNLKSPMISNEPVDYQVHEKMRENKIYLSQNFDSNPSTISRLDQLLEDKKVLETNIKLVRSLGNSRKTQELLEQSRIENLGDVQLIKLGEELQPVLIEDVDPIIKYMNKLRILNLKGSGITVSRALYFVKRNLRIDPKEEIVFKIKGQIIAIGFSIKYRDENGKATIMPIKEDTLFSDVLEKADYSFDVSDSKWKTDSNQWIEVLLNKDIPPELLNSDLGYQRKITKGRSNFVPGYYKISGYFSSLFEGKSNIESNFDTFAKKVILHNFYEDIVIPLRKSYLSYFDESLDENSIERVFKTNFMQNHWMSKKIIEILKSLGANDIHIALWKQLGLKEYNAMKFKEGFENEIDNEKIRDRLDFAIIDFLLRGYICPDISEIEAADLPNNIEQFINGLDKKTYIFLLMELISFSPELLLNRLAESFFTNARETITQIDRTFNTYIGSIKESSLFYHDKIEILAEVFMREVKKGYINSPDDFNVINLIQYNPNAPKLGDFIEKIGGPDILDDFFELVDNGIVQEDTISNTRSYDIGWEIFKSVILTTHVKNSRYTDSNTFFIDLPIDMISTIATDFILNVLYHQERQHVEYGISPATSEGTYEERLAAALRIWYKIFSITSLADIRHRPGQYKIMKRSLINFLITSYLNDLIISNNLQDKDEIVKFIKEKFEGDDLRFLYEIEKIAKYVIGDKIEDPSVFNSLFEDIKRIFTDKTSIEKLLRIDPVTSRLKLYWNAYIGIFLDSGKELTRNQFPSNVFTIKIINDRQVKVPLKTGPYTSALMIIHDEDGKLGVVDPKEIKDLFYEKLVAGKYEKKALYDGYYDKNDDKIYHGIFVCNDEGNYLYSRISFEGGKISVRNEKWYKNDDFVKRYVQEGDSSGQFRLKYYRTLSWITGEQCIAFLQDVESNIYPTEKFIPPVPSEAFKVVEGKLDNIPLSEFLDLNFLAGINEKVLIKSIELQKSLFLESKRQYEHSGVMGILPLDDDWGYVSDRNSLYVGGQIKKGPNRQEIFELFKRLFNGRIDFNDLDNRIYKILNFEFIKGSQERVVKNMIFRTYKSTDGNKLKPFKSWLKEVLQMFNEYDPDSINPDEIDNLIIKSNVQNQEFTFADESMTEKDWTITQDLMSLMERIFGGYTVKKMMTGTMFMNEWGVRFTVCTWRRMHKVCTDLGISLPHNEFVGKIAEHAYSGYSATSIRIKRFIIDSLTSPWFIQGKMILKGLPCETFSPMFKLPVDITQYSKFYSYVSDYLYENFIDWSDDKKVLEKNQAYAKLGQLLVDLLKKQIYREYISRLKFPYVILTESQISLYQRLAVQCVYDSLYNARWAQEVRRNLYDFLVSEGKKDVTLDFSQGRNKKIFGEGNPLEEYEGFYKLKLHWEDYQSFFGKDWAKMANSISFTMEMSERFEPQNIIGKDRIVKIAQFLKYMAKEHGKLRIYGFRVNYQGYGNHYRDKMEYFPSYEAPNIDPVMPSSNKWYYEIDPDNLNEFSIEHYKIFLGALFADHQGFFVRTEDMQAGEFLFAFDAQGVIEEKDIIIADSTYRRPATPSNPLFFSLPWHKYVALEEKWNAIVKGWKNSYMIPQCHKFYTIAEWNEYLSQIEELNEQSSRFSSLSSN